MIAALVDASGLVVNVVEVGDDWMPPDGLTLVPVTDETGPASIGWTWDGTTFAAPPSVPSDPHLREMNNWRAMLQRRMDAALVAGDTDTAFRILLQMQG